MMLGVLLGIEDGAMVGALGKEDGGEIGLLVVKADGTVVGTMVGILGEIVGDIIGLFVGAAPVKSIPFPYDTIPLGETAVNIRL